MSGLTTETNPEEAGMCPSRTREFCQAASKGGFRLIFLTVNKKIKQNDLRQRATFFSGFSKDVVDNTKSELNNKTINNVLQSCKVF